MCYAFPVEALAALADPTRRELVALLARGELAAGGRDAGGSTRSTRGRCGSSTTGWSPTAICGPSGSTHWTPRSPAAGGPGGAERPHDRAGRDGPPRRRPHRGRP